jgi:hypothetical protein
MGVDSAIKTEWFVRMNSIPGLAVLMSCAGHAEGYRMYPDIAFDLSKETPVAALVPQGKEKRWKEYREQWEAILRVTAYFDHHFGDIAEADVSYTDRGYTQIGLEAWLPRIWMSECEFDAWWEEILWRLERLAADGWTW